MEYDTLAGISSDQVLIPCLVLGLLVVITEMADSSELP